MEKGIIFKYPVNFSGSTIIKVPEHSQLLSIQAQGNDVVAYFLENQLQKDTDGVKQYNLYSVGTGHGFTIERNMEYLNTVMLYDGRFVLHVFKV